MSETAKAIGVELLLREFVERERMLRDAVGRGGQTTGDSPHITPSVLKDLEWMLRNGAEVGQAALAELDQQWTTALGWSGGPLTPEAAKESMATVNRERDQQLLIARTTEANLHEAIRERDQRIAELEANREAWQQGHDALRARLAALEGLLGRWLLDGFSPDATKLMRLVVDTRKLLGLDSGNVTKESIATALQREPGSERGA